VRGGGAAYRRFAPIAAQCAHSLWATSSSCFKSGSSGAGPQPSHDHIVRHSAAARQTVPLDRRFGKRQCLPAGLSFLARKCHPLANNGTSCLRLGHRNFLLKLFRSTDGALRRLLHRIVLRSSRQKRATAFMHGAAYDHEAAFRHRGAKAVVRCRFLCVNPNRQNSARTEEIHQPVQGRLKRVKRVAANPQARRRTDRLDGRNCPPLPPTNTRAGATPASVPCSSSRPPGCVGASSSPRARSTDQQFCRQWRLEGKTLHHLFVSSRPSGANRSLVKIDHLRSGMALPCGRLPAGGSAKRRVTRDCLTHMSQYLPDGI
jgi:hypothetical protein